MADLIITAANVQASSRATKTTGTAGAAFTAGQLGYLDPTDGTWKLADADAEASVTGLGVALNNAAVGQPVEMVTDDPDLDLGATLAIGVAYGPSVTPGGIAPMTDLIAGDWPRFLGFANAADSFRLVSGEHNRATAAIV